MNHDRRRTEDLKAQANARMGLVLERLGIKERVRAGQYILISNPMRKDRNPSFVIWTKGGIVTFKDLATGEAGDIFGLVAYLNGWWDLPRHGFQDAARWLEDALGLRAMNEQERRRQAQRSQRRQAEQRKVAEEELARRRGQAKEIFYNALPFLGTPVEAYLRDKRGLDLTTLPAGPRGGDRTPHAIRYLKDHPHIDTKGTRTYWPCMVACCVDPASGDVLAIHRTWLARDGFGKAPVTPARKCWPDYAGCIIPLWKGESRLSVREAGDNGLRETVVLSEGLEDGYTAAIAAPEFRTWAMIALSNMGNLVLPECIDSVIVHRQNEWHNGPAVAAFERGVKALEAQGRPVSIVAAMGGKDLNDTLRGIA